MKLFPNKANIRHRKKLISILEETEQVMHKTLNLEIDTLQRLINISNMFKDLNHKVSFDFVGYQIKIIEDKQSELESKRNEILENYKLLIKEY